MRILQVNTTDASGGAAAIAMALHRGYRSSGHDGWLAVGRRSSAAADVYEIPNVSERPLPARLAAGAAGAMRDRGATAARLAYGLELAAEPRRLRSVRRGHEDYEFPGTRRLLDLPHEPPEMLHLHNLHGWYFDLRMLPALTARVPAVVTMHDTWLLSGHCAYSLDSERWRTGCGECPHLGTYPALRRDGTAENWARKRAIYARSRLHVASPARWAIDMARESILAEGAASFRVIPNGIDLSVFCPGDRAEARRRLGIDPVAPLVLAVGNAAPANYYKDFPTLERALARLGAGRGVTLVSIGDESPEQRHGTASIRFPGYVRDPRELADWYRAADVFVHSARADTFPNTILEALACGLPVVATAVGGVPEQVQDGRTGRLVPAEDDGAFAAAVAGLLDDPELRTQVGSAAAADAADRFGEKRMVGTYLAWFEEIRASSTDASSRIRTA
jgi:glycosyltransferase involved in cell wall biosynthesis